MLRIQNCGLMLLVLAAAACDKSVREERSEAIEAQREATETAQEAANERQKEVAEANQEAAIAGAEPRAELDRPRRRHRHACRRQDSLDRCRPRGAEHP